MKEIIKAFDKQPLIKIEDRNYIINPLLDHAPETGYKLMRDVVIELTKITELARANKIVGEEDRGGYIAALMAYKNKKSLAMVKWNPGGLKGDLSINFRNAYTNGKMYVHGIKKGEDVILVEDIVDSGGTLIAMINLLKKSGVNIRDVVAIAEKIEYAGCRRIKEETGVSVKCLLRVSCAGDRSSVVSVLKNNRWEKF